MVVFLFTTSPYWVCSRIGCWRSLRRTLSISVWHVERVHHLPLAGLVPFVTVLLYLFGPTFTRFFPTQVLQTLLFHPSSNSYSFLPPNDEVCVCSVRESMTTLLVETTDNKTGMLCYSVVTLRLARLELTYCPEKRCSYVTQGPRKGACAGPSQYVAYCRQIDQSTREGKNKGACTQPRTTHMIPYLTCNRTVRWKGGYCHGLYGGWIFDGYAGEGGRFPGEVHCVRLPGNFAGPGLHASAIPTAQGH